MELREERKTLAFFDTLYMLKELHVYKRPFSTNLRIELFLRNDSYIKRLLWIEISSRDIYLGIHRTGKNYHISYHGSGKAFATIDGNKSPLGKWGATPITNGYWMQLIGGDFSSDLASLPLPDGKLSGKLNFICIDVRDYSSNRIGYEVLLIKPHEPNLLFELISCSEKFRGKHKSHTS